MSQEEALVQPTVYTRLSKSVCVFVFTAVNSIRSNVVFPYLPELLSHLFLMVDDNDHDLQVCIDFLWLCFFIDN